MPKLKTPLSTREPQDSHLTVLKENGMKVNELLAKLEKHEAECDLRYQRIEEKLADQKQRLKGLDVKIWGLAVLIIIAPMVHKLLGQP